MRPLPSRCGIGTPDPREGPGFGAIDPHHFGPEVGEDHAGKWHRADPRQFHHLYSGERAPASGMS